MGYLLVFKLKRLLRSYPVALSLFVRSVILIVAAFLMNFLLETGHSVIISGLTIPEAFRFFYYEAFQAFWLINKLFFWLILFILTQMIMEINEKYAPGVFKDILLGKYVQPKVENRIVMFIDLKDSTPIAEKLGHIQYFKFIRHFIYHVSNAVNEYGGRIYQYVGDEVVVSWKFTPENTKKCLAALIEARKNLQKSSEHFRRNYGIVPEFRVGIHTGEVTVGEIGVIKKDLAMSGDTMNTTARIRSACSELNQKFIVSKDFRDNIDLKDWQSESLGLVDLKGKGHGLELFSLKI
jgi:adenylate cyclase